jgi:tight adherence protein C
MNPATLVSMAWMALVVLGGWRYRPRPRRIQALRVDHPAGRGPRAGPAVAHFLDRAADAVGAAVLHRVRPAPDLDLTLARRLGRALLAGAAALPLLPPMAPALALVFWAAPGMKAKRRERRREAALAADLPDVVDLLVLAVGAGLTVALAVRAVARRAPGPLGAELARACDEISLGRRLGDALDDIPARAGEGTRPLVAALLASERYGAPLGPGLERLAHEVRADRRRKAEEAARKIPVKLLFPLVSCTLPAFGLLTVAPLIASAVRSLRL